MKKLEYKGNKNLLEMLDNCGLDEDSCSKSKKLQQMRDSIYYFYYMEMSVEECCCNMNFISRKTFNTIKNKALDKLKSN